MTSSVNASVLVRPLRIADDPCKSGNSMHENRGDLGTPESGQLSATGRRVRASSRTTCAHVLRGVGQRKEVPMNHSNKSGKPAGGE